MEKIKLQIPEVEEIFTTDLPTFQIEKKDISDKELFMPKIQETIHNKLADPALNSNIIDHLHSVKAELIKKADLWREDTEQIKQKIDLQIRK